MAVDNQLVLVVDIDTALNEQHKKLLLTHASTNHVDLATSGKEAIGLLQGRANQNLPLPSKIFFDINMPIVGGVVFFYEFEKLLVDLIETPEVFVFYTNEKQESRLKHLLTSDYVKGFFKKPLTSKDLQKVYPQE